MCRYLSQGMSRNVQSIMEWRCLIYGFQQKVSKYNRIYLLHSPNVRNTEPETTECNEMIFKLIYSFTFRNVLIHFVYLISAAFRYLVYV